MERLHKAESHEEEYDEEDEKGVKEETKATTAWKADQKERMMLQMRLT